MTTAPRAFRRSLKEKKAEARPTIAFTLDWISDDETDDDGNPVVLRTDTLHATMPTNESMFLAAALAGSEDASGAEEAAATMDILRDALPPAEFKVLRQRLHDPEDDVNLDMLQEVLGWLMEEWTAFPTQPQSGSSQSRKSTGVRSTGRAPGKGSTLSTTP